MKGKNKLENKVCGELQVKIAFTVKSGSLLDLTKKDKHRLSVGQLSHTASNISKSSGLLITKLITSYLKYHIMIFRWESDEY